MTMKTAQLAYDNQDAIEGPEFDEDRQYQAAEIFIADCYDDAPDELIHLVIKHFWKDICLIDGERE